MDHAAAHERIADLVLEPGRLAALAASPDAADRALLDHAAGCPDCRAELEAWDATQAALAATLGGLPAAEAELVPIRAPASLRQVVLAEIGATQVEPTSPAPAAAPAVPGLGGGAAGRRPFRLGWGRRDLLGLAAAVLVVIVAGGLVADQVARIDRLAAEARELQRVVAAVDRVLADPDHRVAELRRADGSAGGSISWARHDLVVLTTALPAPADDELYRCWLSQNGGGWAVGQMYFADGTGYWAGSVDEWATFEIGPTTKFRVSLEPGDADPARRTGPILLEADLGAYASRNQ